MRKRQKVLLLVACLMAALPPIWLLSPAKEPVYQGHSLSYWLIRHRITAPMVQSFPWGHANQKSSEDLKQANEAVRQIGPAALPFLLAWTDVVDHRSTPNQKSWKRKLHDGPFGRVVPNILTREELCTPSEKASIGFFILGPSARAAVPGLAHLAATRRDRGVAYRALAALRDIGPDANLAVVGLMTNHSALCRKEAILMTKSLGSNANMAIPALLSNLRELDEGIVHDSIIGLEACLRSTNERVAEAATQALDQLALEPNIVVPALTRAAQDKRSSIRFYAIDAITRFGEGARAAVPVLVGALTDKDEEVRRVATNALVQIAPEALTNAPAR